MTAFPAFTSTSEDRDSAAVRAIRTIETSPSAARLSLLAGRVTDPLRAVVGPGTPAGTIARGEPLGHALHPILVDLPLGCWTSASMLDLFGGRRARPAAEGLVAVGVAAAVPTVLTGWSEWLALPEVDRRVGAVHALGNAIGVTCYVASLKARRANHHAAGVALALAGAGCTAAAGFLGGHLALNQAAGKRI
jgi:uncharacterized membrane protein